MKLPDSSTALLQALIRIPSVNPDGSSSEGATGEKACAEWVGEFLRECGAEVVFEEVRPGRPNVIGRFPGEALGPGILFAPHTDTVSVAGMTVDPFGGELIDSKIHGRGASDTKGTMAAMLWALYRMKEELPRLSRRIAFAGFMGEEAGQPGSRDFAKRHADEFEFALVGEPTELETVYAHKGATWLELAAAGVSCHGSTPERGDNAARKMIQVLDPLLRRMESRMPEFADAVLGNPSVSLGKISAGSSPNIVPSECRAVLDCRETPSLRRAGGAEALARELLVGLGAAKQIAVTVLGSSSPLMTDPSTDGIRRLQSIGSPLTTAPWFCDAGHLASAGIPAVACGPGSIAQAHTKDEFLAVADLEAGADFYCRFLETYRN